MMEQVRRRVAMRALSLGGLPALIVVAGVLPVAARDQFSEPCVVMTADKTNEDDPRELGSPEVTVRGCVFPGHDDGYKSPGDGEPTSEDPEILFCEGQALVEANCGDCMNHSAEALAEGIMMLERAVDLGCFEVVTAYRLLASAHGTMAHVFLSDAPSAREKQSRKQKDAYRKLAEREPANREFLFDYASTLQGEDRIVLLRQILEIDATYPPALFAVGRHEVEQGDARGFERMYRAFELADEETAYDLGTQLIWALMDHGRESEALAVKRKVEKLRDWLRVNKW